VVARGKSSFWRRPGGFSLTEVLIVCLVVSALATAAAPRYLGYGKRAKTAEAKLVVGALWTAVVGNASSACGTGAPVSGAYSRVGLSNVGMTIPPRWWVSAGGSYRITVDCNTGAITPDGDVFIISGIATDVAPLQVKLSYAATATPPSQLKCSADFGLKFVDC
jgi:prepilin-type N-terminal cleavage/methylation domain-containing protein